MDQNKWVIKNREAIYYLDLNDIIRCEASNAYTLIHLVDSSTVLISQNLKRIESSLVNKGFIRTHQTHLVNASKIVRFNKENDLIILNNQEGIPVSQRKKRSVIQFLNSLYPTTR